MSESEKLDAVLAELKLLMGGFIRFLAGSFAGLLIGCALGMTREESLIVGLIGFAACIVIFQLKYRNEA